MTSVALEGECVGTMRQEARPNKVEGAGDPLRGSFTLLQSWGLSYIVEATGGFPIAEQLQANRPKSGSGRTWREVGGPLQVQGLFGTMRTGRN